MARPPANFDRSSYIVYEGEISECVKWLGWAQAQLHRILSVSPGTMSCVLAPTPSVVVTIHSRPNRIFIRAGGGFNVFVNARKSYGGLPDTAFYSHFGYDYKKEAFRKFNFKERFPSQTAVYNSQSTDYIDVLTSAESDEAKIVVDTICVSHTISDDGHIVNFAGCQSWNGYYSGTAYPDGNGLIAHKGKTFYADYGGTVMDARAHTGILYSVAGDTGRYGEVLFEAVKIGSGKEDGSVPMVPIFTIVLSTGSCNIGGHIIAYDGGPPIEGLIGPFLTNAKFHPECSELSIFIDNITLDDPQVTNNRYVHNILDIVVPLSIDPINGDPAKLYIVYGTPVVTRYPGERLNIARTTTYDIDVTPFWINSPGLFGKSDNASGFGFPSTIFGPLASTIVDIDETAISNIYDVIDVSYSNRSIYDGAVWTIGTSPNIETTTWTALPITIDPNYSAVSEVAAFVLMYGYRETTIHESNGVIHTGDYYFVTTLYRCVYSGTRWDGEYRLEHKAKEGQRSIKIGIEYISDKNSIEYGVRKFITQEFRPNPGKDVLEYKEIVNYPLGGVSAPQSAPFGTEPPKRAEQLAYLAAIFNSETCSIDGSLTGSPESFPKDLFPKIYFDNNIVGTVEFGHWYQEKDSYIARHVRSREFDLTTQQIVVNSTYNYAVTLPMPTIASGITPQEVAEYPSGFTFRSPGPVCPAQGFSTYNNMGMYKKFTQVIVGDDISYKLQTQNVSVKYDYVNGMRRHVSHYIDQLSDATTVPVPSYSYPVVPICGNNALGFVIDKTPVEEILSFVPWFDTNGQAFRNEIAPGIFLMGRFDFNFDSGLHSSGYKYNEMWLEDSLGNKIIDIDSILTPSGTEGINSGITVDNQLSNCLVLGLAHS